jgi:hypothetical protein
MFAFVVGEYAEGGGQTKQFVLSQTELPAPGMAMTHVVIDGKGFIEEHALRLQGLQ